MMYEIKKILVQSGLNNRQADIYLACLQYGQLSATSISRITAIPRPSVYDTINKLIKIGYITQSKENKKTGYLAVDPHKIYLMLNEKKNVLESRVNVFKNNLENLEELKKFTGPVPQVKYYEGKDALEYFFQQIASASYSYSIFSLDALLKHVYYDVEKILEKLSHADIKGAKRIMSYSPKAEEYIKKQINPNIERKLLPQGYNMEAELTLFDGILLQMSFGSNPSILEIKHPIYYKAHKTIFDFMRDKLEKKH